MPCDNCRHQDERCSWPTGGRGKVCCTCNWEQVSCQVDREPVVRQGELKAKPKDDRLPKHKKHKVSLKETIVKSETEAKENTVTAEPEVRPWSKVRAGSSRALSEVAEGSDLTWALWSITADLWGIRRAQEVMAGHVNVGW